MLKAGLFDVCSHWYVKGHSEERRLGVVQARKLYTAVYMRVVKDLLTSSSGHFSADDLIRPSRVTWEALEAELAAKKKTAAAPEPTQEPTYIVACPKGRRKYVKYYLSQRGYKNLDALPYSTADKPFWLGYVSTKLREELTALAPDIRFSVG